MTRKDLAGYLVVGTIAAPALIVGALTALFSLPYVIGAWALYHGYNYHEKRAAEKDRPKDE